MRFLRHPLNLVSLVVLSMALMLQFMLPLYADEADSETAVFEEDIVCIEEIAPEANALTQDAITFFEEHYRSEDPNSNLIEGAFEKFQEYEDRMNALLADFESTQAGKPIIGEFYERDDCSSFVNDQIRSVRQTLINHNVETAGAKKSYTLVTKLKEVNEGLRTLNSDFGQMYGSFKAFVDKIQNVTAK